MSDLEEVARWVKHNSLIHGAVTAQQAEAIDWQALVSRSRLWRDSEDNEQHGQAA